MQDPTTDGVPPAWQVWDGQLWYFNKKDWYYRNREGKLLHREVYAAAHGPIADDTEIHHRDHDRANNAAANLQDLGVPEHRTLHGQRRTDDAWLEQQGAVVRGNVTRQMWAERSPVDLECRQCGKQFSSTGMRAYYCSATCANDAHRDRLVRGEVEHWQRKVVKHCEWCSTEFTSATERARFCSLACKKRAARSRREQLARPCGWCKSEFRPKRSDAKFCSAACGAKFRNRNLRTTRYITRLGSDD